MNLSCDHGAHILWSSTSHLTFYFNVIVSNLCGRLLVRVETAFSISVDLLEPDLRDISYGF